MKQVYKCDYCSHIEDIGSQWIMLKHEADCSFNPSVRHCNTCKHFDFSVLGLPEKCKLDFIDFYDVLDEDYKCDLWETL